MLHILDNDDDERERERERRRTTNNKYRQDKRRAADNGIPVKEADSLLLILHIRFDTPANCISRNVNENARGVCVWKTHTLTRSGRKKERKLILEMEQNNMLGHTIKLNR